MPLTRKPLAERFWPKVDKSGPLPDQAPELGRCWLWTAAVNPVSGYGQVSAGGHNGGMLLAHRVSYQLLIGSIPSGDTLDHLCGRRRCVNPAHLDPCTTEVNSTRGAERRDACRSGHAWADYSYINPATGYRRCRACNTERAREYRQRQRRGARGGPVAPLPDALPAASGTGI